MFCSTCGKLRYVKISLGKEVDCNEAMCDHANYFKLGESPKEICRAVKNKCYPVGTYIYALTNEEIDLFYNFRKINAVDVQSNTFDYKNYRYLVL